MFTTQLRNRECECRAARDRAEKFVSRSNLHTYRFSAISAKPPDDTCNTDVQSLCPVSLPTFQLEAILFWTEVNQLFIKVIASLNWAPTINLASSSQNKFGNQLKQVSHRWNSHDQAAGTIYHRVNPKPHSQLNCKCGSSITSEQYPSLSREDYRSEVGARWFGESAGSVTRARIASRFPLANVFVLVLDFESLPP